MHVSFCRCTTDRVAPFLIELAPPFWLPLQWRHCPARPAKDHFRCLILLADLPAEDGGRRLGAAAAGTTANLLDDRGGASAAGRRRFPGGHAAHRGPAKHGRALAGQLRGQLAAHHGRAAARAAPAAAAA